MNILLKFFLNVIGCSVVMALLDKLILKRSFRDSIDIPNVMLVVTTIFLSLKGFDFITILLISGIVLIVTSTIFES